MGTIFLEKHFSPLDILVKNFFNAEQEEFQQPNNRILNHPVDIYEDKQGLNFDIACTGLTKKQIELKVEDDVLRVIYTKKDKDEIKDLHIYLFWYKLPLKHHLRL
jgi:HSP20 family molecular chaperone IbpA